MCKVMGSKTLQSEREQNAQVAAFKRKIFQSTEEAIWNVVRHTLTKDGLVDAEPESGMRFLARHLGLDEEDVYYTKGPKGVLYFIDVQPNDPMFRDTFRRVVVNEAKVYALPYDRKTVVGIEGDVYLMPVTPIERIDISFVCREDGV